MPLHNLDLKTLMKEAQKWPVVEIDQKLHGTVKTKECVAFNGIVIDPQTRITLRKGFSFGLALIEFATLITSEHDLPLYELFSPNFAKFTASGTNSFDGSWGRRIRGMMKVNLRKLGFDRASRQAVWPMMKVLDVSGPEVDLPCAQGYQYLERDGKGVGVFTMRSNDLWLGMPYDKFAITMFHEFICRQRQVEVGELFWNVGSMHLYEHHWKNPSRSIGKVRMDDMPLVTVNMVNKLTHCLRLLPDEKDFLAKTAQFKSDLGPYLLQLLWLAGYEYYTKSGSDVVAQGLRRKLGTWALSVADFYG